MYNDAEFEQSGSGDWIRWIAIIVYGLIIVAYAWQTLELVNWLIPNDNIYMRIVTVFVCDGLATGYAVAEMFYRFRLRKSKNIVIGMWILTFVFSTAATIIQMYLSSTHTIPHTIDLGIITVAYGLVIVAFVVNITAITIIFRLEHGAGRPACRYLDDRRKPVTQAPTRLPAKKPVQMTAKRSQPRKLQPVKAVLAQEELAVQTVLHDPALYEEFLLWRNAAQHIQAQNVTDEQAEDDDLAPDEQDDQEDEETEEEEEVTEAEAGYLDELALITSQADEQSNGPNTEEIPDDLPLSIRMVPESAIHGPTKLKRRKR